ncbi:hypothetical protein Zmor_022582 [Zophobas morio]|uniref:C2H2-type domain-containing protein n=1 Tax=Zophobas morio TaxID=2755281 RepID=A0AA38HWR8_9CUCU|nr:hypothetical protein Zmor_022582 [Zophobas morio]
MESTTPKPTCAAPLEPYKCPCAFQTTLLVNLLSHSSPPHRIFYCKNCNSFSHSSLIFLHHKTHCKKKKTKLWFECEHCFYKTTVKQTLQRHVVAKHTPARQIQWLQCELCVYRAKRQDHLRTHVCCMHPQDGDKWLQCEQCSYRTTQKDRIQKHVLCKHSSEYGFHCDQCDYKSKLKYHLKTHVLNQHPPPGAVQWFQCANCAFKCKVKQALRRHMVLRHKRPRRFGSGECGYRAKRKGNLVRHMGSHQIRQK